MTILDYFRSPFPSRQGFSAYRFPGPAAHLPLFFIFTLAGFLLVGPTPLLLVWMVAGLYLGRDIAVFSHYAPFLLLVIWAVMLGLAWRAQAVAKWGREHAQAGVLLSLLILVVLLGFAWTMTRNGKGNQ